MKLILVYLGCNLMTILFDKTDDIARITLNRPDVHNAFNDEMINDLLQIFLKIENDEETKVVILSANGKNFSAGADLNWMKSAAKYSYEDNLKDAQKLSDMLDALYNLPQITIANVKGAAKGGGLGLMCCCDIVVAEENSHYAFSEVKLGLVPATISPFVVNAIGVRQAKRYFQTGEVITASKGQEIGLVHEVASNTQECHQVIEDMIKNISVNAPLAMKASKRLLDNFRISPAMRQQTAELIAKKRAGKEAKEGLSAFLEKRKPDWKKNV